jgi:hypothetical protein
MASLMFIPVIESGLDNANAIFINNADGTGLSGCIKCGPSKTCNKESDFVILFVHNHIPR